MRMSNTNNISGQFGCNKMSALLCEGPKPNMSMISGILSPRGTLMYGFEDAKNTSEI